jgi:uncharacterized protein YbjT (DUF2867 family)
MSIPDYRTRVPGRGARHVLVAGATGRFGGIVDLLLAHGHAVRAAVRDPASPAAAGLTACGAEVIRADYEAPASLTAAARGVDAVFASGTAHRAGPDGERRHGRNLADALSAAGAPHLVFVSGAGADRHAGLPLFDAKRAVERRIAERGLPATVIAPVYLMENLFNPWNLAGIRAGFLPTPVPPGLPLQQVATADILALAVLAIERPGAFAGERIEVASDAPTGEQAAAVLSGVLGRGFIARQLPGAALPPGLAALFAWLERDPSPVDIGALHARYPDIGWHRYGAWAERQRARLAEVSRMAQPRQARKRAGRPASVGQRQPEPAATSGPAARLGRLLRGAYPPRCRLLPGKQANCLPLADA